MNGHTIGGPRPPTAVSSSPWIVPRPGPSSFAGIRQVINPLSRLPFLEAPIFYYPETALAGSLAEFTTPFLPVGAKIPTSGNLSFTVKYSDSPGRHFAIDVTRFNHKAQNLNSLFSLYSGNAYVTMFAVQKGTAQAARGDEVLQWNVRWRAHFETKRGMATSQIPQREGDVAETNISHIVIGPPNDPLIRRGILNTTLPNCIGVTQGRSPALSFSN